MTMKEAILGISAYYHDSAAALLVDGRLVAAAQEERFTRKKFDAGFPSLAIRYVLREAGLELGELSHVVFYDKPSLKFDRILKTMHALAPGGFAQFQEAIPVWMNEKLFMEELIQKELAELGSGSSRLLFSNHHLSHAASAFFPSRFRDAAILTVDGVGEWSTSTLGAGRDNRIQVLRELDFPHSVGLLYSAFTYYLGFRVNSGEYKLMGLAPYGDPASPQTARFHDLILEHLVDVRDDGSLVLNLEYFQFMTGDTMCRNAEWERLFGLPPRGAEGTMTRDYCDLALAIQQVTERILLLMAREAKKLTGSRHLVMAGGVALNCVANSRLLADGNFEDIWVQPAAGDAGGALGAALACHHIFLGHPREPLASGDLMQGAYLGPAFDDAEILRIAALYGAEPETFQDYAGLCQATCALLEQGKVVGWFQGRMEFGPRALGNRSILGDPRNPDMQKRLNLSIKFREGFRPFAPSVLAEDVSAFFQWDRPSPYMLFTAPVAEAHRRPLPADLHGLTVLEQLYHPRSGIPAVTHVDYSARLQTVHRDTNERYWQLIDTFKQRTGCPVIVNTSFNVRGEPIVCTPEDAYLCFLNTDMDCLVMGDQLFAK
jgi:carbamoyltransferase